MAKPEPTPAPPKKATKSFRRLEVTRLGNDNYEVTELLISGDGDDWRTVAKRVLVSKASRNVAASFVEGWYRETIGPGYMGDSGL